MSRHTSHMTYPFDKESKTARIACPLFVPLLVLICFFSELNFRHFLNLAAQFAFSMLVLW